MNEAALKQTEELEMNNISEQEVRERMAELGKLRDLMFFQELKAKRKKKIKSKTYHRILKKQKERNQLSLEELRTIDTELANNKEEKMEIQRVKERMELRHSKRKSAFSKNANMQNESTRQAVEEQLQLKDQLKKKMMQIDSDNSDNDHEEKDTIEAKEPETQEELKNHRLFGLKFMQRAMAKERNTEDEDFKEEKELTLAEILKKGDQNKKSEPELDVNESEEIPTIQINKKKIPKEGTQKKKQKKRQDETTPIATKQKEEVIQIDQKKVWQPKKQIEKDDEDFLLLPKEAKKSVVVTTSSAKEDNPWLHQEKVKPQKLTENGLHKNAKQKKKDKEDVLQVDLSNAIQFTRTVSKKSQGFDLLASANTEQRELIQRAFATSNVELEFEEEKKKIVDQSNAPEAKEVNLPGWGHWTGEGAVAPKLRKAPKKQIQKPKQNRKDEGLKHVIINEKRDKKAAQFLLPDVPHPFTSREQYERSIRNPIGKDWNTAQTFQKTVEPQIRVKSGTIIQPVTSEVAKQKLNKKKQQSSPKSLSNAKKKAQVKKAKAKKAVT